MSPLSQHSLDQNLNSMFYRTQKDGYKIHPQEKMYKNS